ncbi:MAG: CoA-binding protein [Longimicrobiaceae bacterium]
MPRPTDWKRKLIDDDVGLRGILEHARRVAVLGIKPESRSYKPAHYVPRYLQEVGYQVIPVPVYYPEVSEILGQPVLRDLRRVPPPIDVVQLFRKPEDVPPHAEALLEAKPKAVWMQSGIRHDETAERLAKAGIEVVQDRCMMVEHKRLLA